MIHRILSLFALLLMHVWAPSLVSSRTWTVRKDGTGNFSIVQSAISASSSGDSILVGPGTYVENIDFLNRNIVLKSEMGPASTTLDGSARDSSVVVIKGGQTRAAVLEGFTVTRGRGSRFTGPLGEVIGGGILVINASPTIKANIITENTCIRPAGARVTGSGAGIASGGTIVGTVFSPLYIDNDISRNHAGANGGGIEVCGFIAPEIRNNVIRENWTTYGDGGGIWLLIHVNGAVISGNRIEKNTAGDHGGGLLAGKAGMGTNQMEISHNTIWSNRADAEAQVYASGGGIWLWQTAAHVFRNSIVANHGEGPLNTWGGGIAVEERGSPVIEYNIISHSTRGGAINCIDGATPIVRNNILWENVGGAANGECLAWVGANGNVEADPLFCNLATGILGVAENSPALSHPAGIVGAFQIAGCPAVSIEPVTWSQIKVTFGNTRP